MNSTDSNRDPLTTAGLEFVFASWSPNIDYGKIGIHHLLVLSSIVGLEKTDK
jgi:hypothetical protein